MPALAPRACSMSASPSRRHIISYSNALGSSSVFLLFLFLSVLFCSCLFLSFLVFSFSCPVPRETQPVNAGGRRLSRVAAAAFSGATGAVLGGVRADGHGLPKPGTGGCFLLRLVGCSACASRRPGSLSFLLLLFFLLFLSLSLVVSTSMPKSTPLGCVIENITSSGRPVRKGFVFRAKARPKCQRMGHPPSGHSRGPVRFTNFNFYCYTHAYPAAPSILQLL